MTKLAFPYGAVNAILYADSRYYILYDFENAWTLAIWDIGYDDQSPIVPQPPDRR